jgi:hypothetical protein
MVRLTAPILGIITCCRASGGANAMITIQTAGLPHASSVSELGFTSHEYPSTKNLPTPSLRMQHNIKPL